MQMKLSIRAFERAQDYLLTQGRPLEQARFQRLFAGGSATDVLKALAQYQNEDGGFGHALEPDCRAPESNVLATVKALHRLYQLGASSEAPMLVSLVKWLQKQLQTNKDGSFWSFLPPTAETSPHAPWWNQENKHDLAERFGGFWVNPRAEIIALLWQWPQLLPEGLLTQLTAETKDAILLGVPEHDLYGQRAAAFFAGMPALPPEYRQPVFDYLNDVLPVRLQKAAHPHAFSALWVAPVPEHPLGNSLRVAIHNSLDQLIQAQGEDGAWEPVWDWSDQFPETWPQAHTDWKSIQTMNALSMLWAWNRLGSS